uniref:Uncharacterized protein n=1 Tax=Bracon brevicornis TaxID=1563983 RepID=A0A6V7JKA2_9HYME
MTGDFKRLRKLRDTLIPLMDSPSDPGLAEGKEKLGSFRRIGEIRNGGRIRSIGIEDHNVKEIVFGNCAEF